MAYCDDFYEYKKSPVFLLLFLFVWLKYLTRKNDVEAKVKFFHISEWR